jgi:hypothetical protein
VAASRLPPAGGRGAPAGLSYHLFCDAPLRPGVTLAARRGAEAGARRGIEASDDERMR